MTISTPELTPWVAPRNYESVWPQSGEGWFAAPAPTGGRSSRKTSRLASGTARDDQSVIVSLFMTNSSSRARSWKHPAPPSLSVIFDTHYYWHH